MIHADHRERVRFDVVCDATYQGVDIGVRRRRGDVELVAHSAAPLFSRYAPLLPTSEVVMGRAGSAGMSSAEAGMAAASRCAPSAATMAPLSVHNRGRGTRNRSPAAAQRSPASARSREFAATPPPISR